MKLTIWGVVMMSSKSAIIGSLVLILTVVSASIAWSVPFTLSIERVH